MGYESEWVAGIDHAAGHGDPHERRTILLAFAVAGLGVISLATGHFAAVWQPVPKSLPGQQALAYANGVLMAALGVGMLGRRTRARAALILTAYFVVWFVLLHGPVVAAAPGVAANWSGFGECGTLIVGAILMFAGATAREDDPWARFLAGDRGVRIARITFALAAFLMSLDKLAYLKGNADFPPAWIRHWIGWGYLVGIGFIATGLAVSCRILPRLATCLAARMMSLLALTSELDRADGLLGDLRRRLAHRRVLSRRPLVRVAVAPHCGVSRLPFSDAVGRRWRSSAAPGEGVSVCSEP
jgi:hypothetical protein